MEITKTITRKEFIDQAKEKWFDITTVAGGLGADDTRHIFCTPNVLEQYLSFGSAKKTIEKTDSGFRLIWEGFYNHHEVRPIHQIGFAFSESYKDLQDWGAYLGDGKVIADFPCRVIYDNPLGEKSHSFNIDFLQELIVLIPNEIIGIRHNELQARYSSVLSATETHFSNWFFDYTREASLGDFLAEIPIDFEHRDLRTYDPDDYYLYIFGITNKPLDSPEWQMVINCYCEFCMSEQQKK